MDSLDDSPSGESIRYMYQKLKSLILDDAAFGAILVILVGIGSFGLGRLSVQENVTTVNEAAVASTFRPVETPRVVPESVIVPDVDVAPVGVTVVASRSGTKYHLPDCPGAKQMKPENRIEFPSSAAAEAAGYTPAANCPGL